MDIHKKKIVDYAKPLPNEQHESFCQSYIELDLEHHIVNKRARRIRAYKNAFPDSTSYTESVINSRASVLLRNENVSGRIGHLYEENGASVDNLYSWTLSKSTDVLLNIVYDEDTADKDKLVAIKELNKMTGIDVPKAEEEEDKTDRISDFLQKFRGGK